MRADAQLRDFASTRKELYDYLWLIRPSCLPHRGYETAGDVKKRKIVDIFIGEYTGRVVIMKPHLHLLWMFNDE